MRINTNIQALNAYRNLSLNQFALGRNMERLSSGLRINRAADDAAGLAISEKMRSQIRGLEMAERNALNGISLLQTAEGALNEVHSMLQRMRELAVQAANETNDIADRREIQKEINQLLDEIDRISRDTEFNTKKLLDGTLAKPIEFAETGTVLDLVATPIAIGAGTNNNTISFRLADGTITEVTLPDKTYDGTSGAELSDLRDDIQALIDSVPELVEAGVQVGINNLGNSLVFNATEEVHLLASEPDSALADLGFSTDTTLTSLPETMYQATGTAPLNIVGDPVIIGSGNNIIEFTLNGSSISITLSTGTYDGVSSGGMLHDLLADIQAQINSNPDLSTAGVKVDVDSEGALVFTSTERLAIKNGSALADLNMEPGPLAEVPPKHGIALQIGANEGQQLRFEINAISTKTLGYGVGTIAYDPNDPNQALYGNLDSLRVDPNILETATSGGVLTNIDAGRAITIFDKAIQQTSSERSKMGAIQNRLEHAMNNLSTTRENVTAAESRIRDTDMAKEMTEFTKNNIKNQAATAMLAQANQLPQGVLQLLQ